MKAKRICIITLSFTLLMLFCVCSSVGAYADEDIYYVDRVDLTDVPEGKVGEQVGSDSYRIDIDTQYGIICFVDIEWRALDYTTGNMVEYNGTIESGKIYKRLISLNVNSKGVFCDFTDNPTVTVNGKNVEEINQNSLSNHLSFDTLHYSGTSEISDVTALPKEPIISGTPITDDIFTVPADANYFISGISWWNSDTLGNKFEYGKHYACTIYFCPNSGYTFSEKLTLDPYKYAYGAIHDYEFSIGEPIDEVEISYELPKIGDLLGRISITLPKDANYHVEPQWGKNNLEFDYSFGWEEAADDGDTFYLRFRIYPKEGYSISENLRITVNGTLVDTIDDNWGNYYKYTPSTQVHFVAQQIQSIDLTIKDVSLGNSIPYTTCVQSDYTTYSASYQEAIWKRSQTNDYSQATTITNYIDDLVFQEGYYYWCQVQIKPNKNCFIADNVTVTANGKTAQLIKGYNNSYFVRVEIGLVTDRSHLIDTIELTNIIKPTAGQNASADCFSIPEDANYSISDCYWRYDGALFTGIFELGKTYSLYIDLEPKEGYSFAEDAKLIIDNKPVVDYDRDDITTHYNPISLSVYNIYNASVYGKFYTCNPIESISLTASDDAMYVGMPFIGGSFKIKTDDRRCSSFEYGVFAYNTTADFNSASGADDENFVKSGYYYWYHISLRGSSNGYYGFTDESIITINGKEVPFVVDSKGQAHIFYMVGPIVKEATEIKKVDLNATTAYIGTHTDDTRVEITNGANCEVDYYGWFVNNTGDENDPSTEEFEGIFEKGKYYFLAITLEAKKGYTFSDETTVTANGKKLVVHLGPTSSNEIVTNVYAVVLFEPAEDDRIDLNEVAITVNGPFIGTHSDTASAIVSEGCKIEEIAWFCSQTNDPNTSTPFSGVFEENMYYWCTVRFGAANGYKLSENAVITVNGKKPILSESDGSNYMNTGTMLVPNVDIPDTSTPETSTAPETSAAPETTTPSNPNTGDSHPLGIIVTIMVVSVIAATTATVLSKKRKHR